MIAGFRGAGRPALATLAVVAAALAAMATFAARVADPERGATVFYLATIAGGVLLPLAAVEPRGRREVTATAVLLALAAWVVPGGEVLGAAVTALLVAATALTLAPALAARRPPSLATLAAAAVALQFLLRAERALEPRPGLTGAVVFAALPAIGAAALAVLTSRRDPRAVLVTAAALLALAPGWRVAPTLALAAIAACEWGRAGRTSFGRWAPLAATLLAAFLWRPGFAVVLALALLLLWEPAALWPRLAAGAGAVLFFAVAPGERALATTELAAPLGAAAVALPVLALGLAHRAAPVALALALAVVAAARLPLADAGHLAPLAVAALLAAEALPRRGRWANARGLQEQYSAALLAGAAFLTGLPWLRPRPVAEIGALLGLPGGFAGALLVAAIFAALAGFAGSPGRARLAAGLLALAGIVAGLPRHPVRPFTGDAVTLTPAAPVWRAELGAAPPVSLVLVDSYLSHGADLAPGTPVATVALAGADGGATLELRAGRDTGEWAARRADVAARPDLVTPEPWIAWVAPGREFFAQRYRARLALAGPLAPTAVEIRLAADLPPQVRLALFHVELRPSGRWLRSGRP